MSRDLGKANEQPFNKIHLFHKRGRVTGCKRAEIVLFVWVDLHAAFSSNSPCLHAKTASLSLLFSLTYTHPLNLCLSFLLWIMVIRISPWLKFGKSWRGNRFSNQKLPLSWNPDAYLAEKCSSTMGAKVDARLYTESQHCSFPAMLDFIQMSQLSTV